MDIVDVRAMIDGGLVVRALLQAKFDEIRPELYRFPAIDERRFAAAVDEAVE